MTVNPNLLAIPPCPMARLPNVISPARPVTRATNIVGSVVSCDADAAGIPGIIRTGSVIRAIARVSRIIPFAASCPEQGRKQKN
jgi:hypothetical protein